MRPESSLPAALTVASITFAFVGYACGTSSSGSNGEAPPIGTGGAATAVVAAPASQAASNSASASGTTASASSGGMGCMDGMKDNQETDVDCGGGTCDACGLGKNCSQDSDCTVMNCIKNKCVTPTCTDQKKNQDETDVDCGGMTCTTRCSDGKQCKEDSDCGSGNCANGSCQEPTCNDGKQNGKETDVDCGGGSCPACAPTLKCGVDADCKSKICYGADDAGPGATDGGAPGTCAQPSCTDGILNGLETDVDCGGAECPECKLGKKCMTPTDCTSNVCNQTCVCPMDMVNVPIVGTPTGFCIDANEVTYQQYLAFYNSNPLAANQDADCLWNTDFTPSGNWPQPAQNQQHAISNVNWCQAAAYCKYLGRHLCGEIGGGPSSAAAANDYTQDEWFDACTAQGKNTWPYGASFDNTKCWSTLTPPSNPPLSGTQGSSTFQGCIGGEANLFEMSGNAAEWVNNCSGSTDQNDTCAVRGGSWLSDTSDELRCDSGGTLPTYARDYSGDDVGFRCCL